MKPSFSRWRAFAAPLAPVCVAGCGNEAAASGVQGYGIAWTPTPALADIPAWSPRCLANGAVFHGRTLLFTSFKGNWRLEIHDCEFDPLLGTAAGRAEYPDLQTIYVDLPAALQSGDVFEKAMGYGGGYFQIKRSPGANQITSWNTSVAWAIAVDAWNVTPWQSGGQTFQRAGSASGRLYICFQGTEGLIQNSFVAGHFRDIPVIYYGQP